MNRGAETPAAALYDWFGARGFLFSTAMHWLTRHRLLMLALICAFWTAVIIAMATLRRVPFADSLWSNETNVRDAIARKGRRTPAPAEFVFLGIDEPSKKLDQVSDEEVASSAALMAMRQGFPWSRDVQADLLERLCGAGARLVLFDLLFNPDRPGDDAFAQALEKYRDRVVLGANIASGGNSSGGHTDVTFILPNRTLIPQQLGDDRVGFVNYWPRGDGRMRDVNYTVTDAQILALSEGLSPLPARPDEPVYEGFDARALRKLGRADLIPRDGTARTIRFGPSDAYQPRSIFQVFVPAMWERNYGSGTFFKDKIVLVGSASAIEHDVHPTTIGDDTPGPAMHLHAVAAALNQEFIGETSPLANLALLVAAGIAAWCLVAFVRQTLLALTLQLAASAGYVATAVYLYDTRNIFVLMLPVLGAFNLSSLFSLGYDFTLERIERVRTRRTLERYVSKNLVKEILDNPDSFYSSLRGVRLPATILFSDIVGFTTLTENADPEALVRQLNEYLSRMTTAVFAHNGTLDKFIGDAVMAVWGNVSSRGKSEDAKACARSALTMRRDLHVLNQAWHAAGIAPFAIGIGINHGDVLVGNIGSHEKADPTVIGDAVNLASRLEGLTRTYGTDILVGESAAELIRDDFVLRSVARVQVKGKTKPIDVFTLIGARNAALDGQFLKSLATYEEAMGQFRGRRFADAKLLFSRFLESFPTDALARMYLARANEYELEPPEESWNAVEIFKKK